MDIQSIRLKPTWEFSLPVLAGLGFDPSMWTILRGIGVPLILVAFYVDGLILGKILPPSALYIVYIGLVSLSPVALVSLTLACIAASTLGQWTLYHWLRQDPGKLNRRLESIPYLLRFATMTRRRIGARRMAIISRNFDRFGGYGIGLSNAIPGIRSLMTIPAGLNQYPQRPFLLFSALGNTIYLLLLWLVAQGIIRLTGVFPTP